VQLRALSRDVAQHGKQLVVCGLDPAAAAQAASTLTLYADLDRALEAAEDALLAQRPPAEQAPAPEVDLLGELGDHLDGPGRVALQAAFVLADIEPGTCIFVTGDRQDSLCIVQSGHVTLCTLWPPAKGLRLATIGRGMVFGEMAFLNGLDRTACAGAEAEPVRLARLDRAAFDRWALAWPREALVVMGNLALMGTRRLAATTRQLRAVLE
jgi:SulP family sulfate permease